jgi:hypothetical protein
MSALLTIFDGQRRHGVPTQHPVPALRTPVLAKTPLPLQVQQLVLYISLTLVPSRSGMFSSAIAAAPPGWV